MGLPEDLKEYKPSGFVVFEREECAWILAAILGAAIAPDIFRAFVEWMFR